MLAIVAARRQAEADNDLTLLETINNWANEFTAGVKTGEMVLGAISGLGGAIGDIGTAMTNAGIPGGELITGIGDTATSVATGVGNAVGSLTGNADDNTFSDVAAVAGGAGAFAGGADTTQDQATAGTGTASTTAQPVTATSTFTPTNTGSATTYNPSSQFNVDPFGTAATAVNVAGNTIDYVSDAVSGAFPFNQNGVDNAADFFQVDPMTGNLINPGGNGLNTPYNINQTQSSSSNPVVSGVTTLAGGAIDLGESLIGGAVNATTDVASGVYNAGVDVVEATVDTFIDIWDVIWPFGG